MASWRTPAPLPVRSGERDKIPQEPCNFLVQCLGLRRYFIIPRVNIRKRTSVRQLLRAVVTGLYTSHTKSWSCIDRLTYPMFPQCAGKSSSLPYFVNADPTLHPFDKQDLPTRRQVIVAERPQQSQGLESALKGVCRVCSPFELGLMVGCFLW